MNFFTKKYRIIQNIDQFGNSIYVAQYREYFTWKTIQRNFFKGNIVELHKHLGRDNKCNTLKEAELLLSSHAELTKSLVKPRIKILYY